MKPKVTGDVQALPLGSQIVTALQGRPVSSSPPASGQALEWSSSNKQWSPAYPPGTVFGYDSISSTVNVTGLASSTATTVISASAHNFDGSTMMAEFYAPIVQTPSVAGGSLDIGIFESTTLLALLAEIVTPAAANMRVPVYARWRVTPSAGNHTYSIQAWTSSVTGTPFVTGGSGTQAPAFLRFTKV